MSLETRSGLLALLNTYHSSYPEEQSFNERYIALLQSPGCYHRDHLPGHITASAWIADAERKHVVLLHHAKLNRWLQPGGHADGNENCLAVALREAEEETGLKDFQQIGPGIFDLDIHLIPEHGSFPEHWHYDVRVFLQTRENFPLIVSHESHQVAWVPLDQVIHLSQQNKSIIRMMQKMLNAK